jgi:hypothetical protein
MRRLSMLALILALGCARAPSPAPSAAPGQAAPDPAAQRGELEEIDRRLATTSPFGSGAGHLLERRGALLESLGRTAEAIQAYDAAARAYAQSPEATNMPVINSDRARAKADRLRKAP